MKNKIYLFCKAIVNLYGMIYTGRAIEIYNQYQTDEITEADLYKALEDSADEIDARFIAIWKGHLVHEAIDSDEDWNSMLLRKADKPWYNPAWSELMLYSDVNYYEKNREYQILKRFITSKLLDGDQLLGEEMIIELHYIVSFSIDMQDIMMIFDRYDIVFDSEEQVKKTLGLVMDLANATRLWDNNGYTPNEMGAISRAKEFKENKHQKIGRNDLCPCGSGKKYKKCCGRIH